jgi:hypothetical protein
MKLIKKEILRLTSMDMEEIDEWYWSMFKILNHNFKHLPVHSKKQITDFINILETKWESLIK